MPTLAKLNPLPGRREQFTASLTPVNELNTVLVASHSVAMLPVGVQIG